MADRIEEMRRACPHCGDTFKAIPQAFANADVYDREATVRADCCGMAVRITPVRRFHLSHSERTTDDWGQPCGSARQKGGA